LDVEGTGGVILNAGNVSITGFVGIGKAPTSNALDVAGTINATAVQNCVYNP
jgi:hypothetical protein